MQKSHGSAERLLVEKHKCFAFSRRAPPRLHRHDITRTCCSAGRPTPQEALAATTRRTCLLAATTFVLGGMGGPARARLEALNEETDAASSAYIQQLLKNTEEKREERYKQRLRDYDRRNFRDYFGFETSSRDVARRRGISDETYDKIQQWLKDNP